MTNIEKYKQTFLTTFGVGERELQKLTYQGVDAWDSVGHMALIAGLEEIFDIMIETDDILDFNSFKKGYEILNKYGIEL
jgi:acyl carrier protein